MVRPNTRKKHDQRENVNLLAMSLIKGGWGCARFTLGRRKRGVMSDISMGGGKNLQCRSLDPKGGGGALPFSSSRGEKGKKGEKN